MKFESLRLISVWFVVAIALFSVAAEGQTHGSVARCRNLFTETFPRAKALEASENETVRQAYAGVIETQRQRAKMFKHYLRIREALFDRPGEDAKILEAMEIDYIRRREQLPELTAGEVERIYANNVATRVRELTVELREQLARTLLLEYRVELDESDRANWKVRWLGKILGGVNHWSPLPKGEASRNSLNELISGIFNRDMRVLTPAQVDAVLRAVELEKARPKPNMNGRTEGMTADQTFSAEAVWRQDSLLIQEQIKILTDVGFSKEEIAAFKNAMMRLDSGKEETSSLCCKGFKLGRSCGNCTLGSDLLIKANAAKKRLNDRDLKILKADPGAPPSRLVLYR